MVIIVSQEKCINKIYKKLADSNSMPEKGGRRLKLVETKPEIMYVSCKVHKKRADRCPSFRSILSNLQTITHKITKFLVLILEPLNTNKYIVKEFF